MFEQELEKTKNPAIKRIGNYLKERAQGDEFVAATLKKENKTLKECWDYVLGEISKKMFRSGNFGCVAGDDQELFDLAVHYYQEDDIKINKLPSNMTTVDASDNSVKEDKDLSSVKKKNEELSQKLENITKELNELKHSKTVIRKVKKSKNNEADGQISIFDEVFQ